MTEAARDAVRRLQPAKPVAAAYVLGLLSSTSPRLINVALLLGKRRLTLAGASTQSLNILRHALAPHRFPTFCAILVGGSTLLPAPINVVIILLLRLVRETPAPQCLRLARITSRFVAALLSASAAFQLLNNRWPTVPKERGASSSATPLEVAKPTPFNDPPETSSLEVDPATLVARRLAPADLAGRTMDLTFFSVVRALDIVITSLGRRLGSSRRSPKLKAAARATPSVLFWLSSASIMHAFFYAPSRLPKAYNKWILVAAELDTRLLTALRHARYGTWVYGRDTGMAPLLTSMARDYGLPEEWGDPAIPPIPVPCELVHQGAGKSCEKHALHRFWRGWWMASKMYAPLHIIVLARHVRTRVRARKGTALPLNMLGRTALDMSRSSAFLGAFIALFYYGVCLSRTRLGPKVFSPKTVTPQMWDGGLCVLAGCLICGTSILIEQQKKRLEILLFVLPRAAATWFPRRYLPEHQWKEHLAFTLSAAIVLTTAQEAPERVRGVLGRILSSVLKTD